MQSKPSKCEKGKAMHGAKIKKEKQTCKAMQGPSARNSVELVLVLLLVFLLSVINFWGML